MMDCHHHPEAICVCVCVSVKGTALVNQGLIKRAGFIWSEQYVQEPLLSYVSNRDLSSDTEQGGAPLKSNNPVCVHVSHLEPPSGCLHSPTKR